jgi:phosphohistidine swiveling domain-containing protein
MIENKQLIGYIKNNRWYRQASSATSYFSYYALLAYCKHLGKFNCMIHYSDGFHKGYFNLDKEIQLAKETLEKAKKDNQFIDEVISKWEKLELEQKEMLDFVNSEDFMNISEEEFIKFQMKFGDFFYEMWIISLLIEPFDPCGDDLLNEEIKRSGIKLNKDERDILFTPEETFFHSLIEKELIKIALEKYGLDLTVDDVKDVQEKYFWNHNDWGRSVIRTEEEFLLELQELFKKDKLELENKLKEIEEKPQKVKKVKQEIISKHNISEELQNVFHLFSRFTYFREIRKANVQKTVHCLDIFENYIKEKTGISKKLVRNIYWRELTSLDLSSDYVKQLEEREEHFMGIAIEDGGSEIKTSDEAIEIVRALDKQIDEQHTDIKGIVANKGIIKGVVKVINDTKDFGKFMDRDILVAPMTRPEYVPLMKKAAAIITDEGGITCHAAIVSRELGIPCIIGTQIATRILKDGDMVEVDADKGIVRKIEEEVK